MKKSMKRGTKMGWIVAALVGVAVLVVWVIYINRSWTEEEVERAKVDVQQRVCFALMADGQEVAYFSRFSERDSTFVGLTTNQDSAWVKSENVGVWVNSSSSFPSANGLILAVDEESQMESQAKFVSKELGVMMERNRLRMEDEMKRAASIADEVDYYLLHHSIADNEYIGVANYSYALTSDMRHMKKMSALLDSLMLYARKMEVKVVREYEKDGIPLRLANGFLERPSLLHMRSESEEVRFVVLKNDSLTEMPDSCVALSTPLFCNTDFSDLIYEWKVKFRHLNYHSPLVEGGALTSLDFYRYIERDTLFYGASTDTLENAYTGMMTEDGQPKGYGVMRYGNGDYYEGEWLNGGRHGRGFLVADGQLVQAGEWADNKYLGEKMTHSDNRVYGIDISRYQHEIGGRVYGINWNAMRITSLGARNNKQMEGDINFPVSYIYIKSTQGVTIKSAYYQQDARDARNHGIICGAYHFFSFKATGKEQAKYFLENTEILSGDMPPVLDVEPTDQQIEEAGGEERMFNDMRVWLQVVEHSIGKKPILYVSQNFVKTHLVHAPDLCQNYQVWIARYNVYRPDVRLLFWQLCYDGRVAGIHGGVDINIFNGYKEQFEEFVSQQK